MSAHWLLRRPYPGWRDWAAAGGLLLAFALLALVGLVWR